MTNADSEPVRLRDGLSLEVLDGVESATGVSGPSVVTSGTRWPKATKVLLVCSTLVPVEFGVSPTVVGSTEGICMGVSTGSMGMIERPSQSLLDPISKTRTWGLGGGRARRRDRRGVVPTPCPDAENREEPVSIPVAL